MSKTHREQVWELDSKIAYRALQDARAYVTDFDRDGSKAEEIYKHLARARRLMEAFSTDGTAAQAKKAIEYLGEITSILSDKIGPASRREFPEQGGRGVKKRTSHVKTAAELDREIAEVIEPCDKFSPCRGNYACCIHAPSTPGTMEYNRTNKGKRA